MGVQIASNPVVTWFGHPVEVVEYRADPDLGLVAIIGCSTCRTFARRDVPAYDLRIEA